MRPYCIMVIKRGEYILHSLHPHSAVGALYFVDLMKISNVDTYNKYVTEIHGNYRRTF